MPLDRSKGHGGRQQLEGEPGYGTRLQNVFLPERTRSIIAEAPAQNVAVLG